MKKFISSILVVLFMFTTPVSRVDVYARDRDSHSAFSTLEGPLSLAIKIILYPLAVAGAVFVVGWGIGEAGDYLRGYRGQDADHQKGKTFGEIQGGAERVGALALEAGITLFNKAEGFVKSHSAQAAGNNVSNELLGSSNNIKV